jgi:hypothetical protein
MADKETGVPGEDSAKLSHEEWLRSERERLKRGFSYTPPPPAPGTATTAGAADQALAGLGLGAAAAAGALGPHPNPITFQGIRASVITNALRSEISDDDTRVRVQPTDEGTVAVISQSMASAPHRYAPVLTVTLLEAPDALTVTVSELRKSALREKWGSIGGTVLEQTGEVLGARRRRGVGGLIDVAASLKDGVEDLVDDIQDLNLPRRVWRVIDRVGGAAEEAYLEEVRKARAIEWQREAALRAYTRCEWCGRAYAPDEGALVECPACGGTRGSAPQP